MFHKSPHWTACAREVAQPRLGDHCHVSIHCSHGMSFAIYLTHDGSSRKSGWSHRRDLPRSGIRYRVITRGWHRCWWLWLGASVKKTVSQGGNSRELIEPPKRSSRTGARVTVFTGKPTDGHSACAASLEGFPTSPAAEAVKPSTL